MGLLQPRESVSIGFLDHGSARTGSMEMRADPSFLRASGVLADTTEIFRITHLSPSIDLPQDGRYSRRDSPNWNARGPGAAADPQRRTAPTRVVVTSACALHLLEDV